MADKDNEGKGIFYGIWIIAGSFVLLFLFAGAGFYSFSIFIKPLEEAFGWSRAAVSMAMSIYMIFHGLCAPLVGHLTEAYGPKKIMTAFALSAGAAFILVSFTQTLLFFYASYAFLAVSTSGIGFIPVSSLLARWFVKRRGTAIGFAMVGISAGGFIMSPLVGFLNSQFSWRASYIFLGVLVWILAVPITFFVMKGSPEEMGLQPDGNSNEGSIGSLDHRVSDQEVTTPDRAMTPPPSEEGWPLQQAIGTRTFWWVAITYLLAPLAQGGVLQHQVPIILEAGLAPTLAATALGITAGMGGFGKLGFGRLSELLPFHYAATLCFGLQALSIFLLLMSNSAIMVWIYVFLYGFAMGGVIVLLPLVVGHFFGLASFGSLVGIVTFIQSVGSASGAYLSGLIYDWQGNYRLGLMLFTTIYLAAVVTIFLAGKPKVYMVQEGEVY